MNETLEEYHSICHGEGVNLSNLLNKFTLQLRNFFIYKHSIFQNNTWETQGISLNISYLWGGKISMLIKNIMLVVNLDSYH